MGTVRQRQRQLANLLGDVVARAYQLGLTANEVRAALEPRLKDLKELKELKDIER